MKSITIIGVVVGVSLFITGCCLIDHTKTIEKVAEPMLKELQQFYKEYNRYPTIKERDVMLKRSGCKIEGDVCFFEGEELHIVHSGKDISGNYYMSIRMFDGKAIPKNSLGGCGFTLRKNHKTSGVFCAKAPCIQIRQ